jgi:hypothetical protein
MIVPLRPILEHYAIYFHDTDSWQKTRCPVHDDGVPSCSLNLGTNYMECHACPFKGHTLDLIMAKENLSDRQAALAFAKGILGDGDFQISGSSGWRSGRSVRPGAGFKPRYGGGLQNRVRR